MNILQQRREKNRKDLKGEEGLKEKEDLKGVEEKKAKEVLNKEEEKNIGLKEEPIVESVSLEVKDQMQQGDAQPEEENVSGDERMEGCSDKLDLGEHVEDEIEKIQRSFLKNLRH